MIRNLFISPVKKQHNATTTPTIEPEPRTPANKPYIPEIVKMVNPTPKMQEQAIKNEISQIRRGVKDWQYIIIHHSWSPDSQKASDWEGITRWHTGKIGSPNPKSPDFNSYILTPMRDNGYHWGEEYVNNILTLRRGRSMEWGGGHTKGFNDKAIGICVIGNYDKQTPVIAQMNAVLELCQVLMRLYNISAKHILGHRETYEILGKPVIKTCPGKLFDVNMIREHFLQNGFI